MLVNLEWEGNIAIRVFMNLYEKKNIFNSLLNENFNTNIYIISSKSIFFCITFELDRELSATTYSAHRVESTNHRMHCSVNSTCDRCYCIQLAGNVKLRLYKLDKMWTFQKICVKFLQKQIIKSWSTKLSKQTKRQKNVGCRKNDGFFAQFPD